MILIITIFITFTTYKKKDNIKTSICNSMRVNNEQQTVVLTLQYQWRTTTAICNTRALQML